jgi:hypothetical protein
MRLLDPGAAQSSKAAINPLVMDINRVTADASSQKEKYVVQPHLHDLQEVNLHKMQHRLVISEIAQFPEHVTKRKWEKMRELQAQIPTLGGVPSRPKMREGGGLKEVELKFGRERSSSSCPGSRNGQGCAGV